MCNDDWQCDKFEGDRGARVGCCDMSQFEIDIRKGKRLAPMMLGPERGYLQKRL